MSNRMGGFYEGKKVLVTGHTGFKGSWMTMLLRLLGAEVTGVALKPKTEPSIYEILKMEDQIHAYLADVRDYDALIKIFDKEKPEIVFHLAAQPIVIDSYQDPRYTYEVNVMGTVNVCECVRRCGSVKSFVNITTDKVYRNNEWAYPYREEDVLDGYDPYSNSKSCSELVTAAYIRGFFKDANIAVSTCRAGNVIGGGDFSRYRIVPDCYRALAANHTIAVRNLHSIRPYQHVLEAVLFYLFVAKRQSEDSSLQGSYNVGPEFADCITTARLCELFCANWGGSARWEQTGHEGPHEANVLRLDTSRAKTILSWSPVWDVKRTVEETVRWYQEFCNQEDMRELTEEQISSYLSEASGWWSA